MIVIEVLGDPVLRRDGAPVSGRAAYRRRIALLAILAAARGRPVGRERLIGLLWPEHPADAARHTLSEALYVLRRELGEECFVSLGDEVALAPGGIASDVDAFERALEEGRAEEAVALYRGPFLDGFYVADAEDFHRWVDGERDRLARLYARAVERLAEAAEAAGSPLRAAEWWRRLAAHDPFSSRVSLRLARSLLAAGEHTAALREAEAHAALLHEELGVGPDAELVAFVERLRAGAVPLAPRSRPPPAPARVEEEDEDEEEDAPSAAPPSPSPDASTSGDAPTTATSGLAPPPDGTAMPSPALPAEERGTPGSRGRLWRYAASGAVLAALLTTVGLLAARRGPDAAKTAPRLDPRRIAVLYFDDYSRGGELGYLANGLTEMLIHELSQVEALDVVSRNGVKPYRQGTVPLDSVAARLRVGSVVEGSVQASGDSVRVTVQLIDANTLSHLESRVVVRPMGDVLALEDALAREVSGFLRRRLGREVRLHQVGSETRVPEARDLVLRGSQMREDAIRIEAGGHALDGASAVRLLQRADSLLARAEELDPSFSLATVERGEVALSLARRVGESRREALLSRAEAAAGRVLGRRPRDPRALVLRGLARWRLAGEASDTVGQRGRLDAAEADLRAAVGVDPGQAGAWAQLSHLLRFRGRFAESDLAARRALAQDAYLDQADEILLRLYYGAMAQGDYPEAGRRCDGGAAQFPADWRFVECRLTLLREDPARAPDPAEAWRLVAELDRLDPPARAREAGRRYWPWYRRAAAAAVLARAGQADSARAVLARARRQVSGDAELRLSLLYDEAYVHLLLGDRAQARRLLEEYLAARPALRPYVARDVLFRDLMAAPAAAPGPAAPR